MSAARERANLRLSTMTDQKFYRVVDPVENFRIRIGVREISALSSQTDDEHAPFHADMVLHWQQKVHGPLEIVDYIHHSKDETKKGNPNQMESRREIRELIESKDAMPGIYPYSFHECMFPFTPIFKHVPHETNNSINYFAHQTHSIEDHEELLPKTMVYTYTNRDTCLVDQGRLLNDSGEFLPTDIFHLISSLTFSLPPLSFLFNPPQSSLSP